MSRREFWDLVEVLHAAGSTILLASAYFDEVERCQRVVFLHDGRVLATGSADELAQGHATLEQAFRARMADVAVPDEGVGGGAPSGGVDT